MRLFVAVNIPEGLKEDIFLLQDEFRGALADVKWLNKDKFHLTLKFLGETDEGYIESIAAVIEKSLEGISSFQLAFFGAGVFPSLDRPRVIWVGASLGKEILEKIAQNLDQNLQHLGYQPEKRGFSVHLTLGRFRSQKNKTALIKRMLASEKKEIGSFEIKTVDLMQSILHPEGPEYKCIKSISV